MSEVKVANLSMLKEGIEVQDGGRRRLRQHE